MRRRLSLTLALLALPSLVLACRLSGDDGQYPQQPMEEETPEVTEALPVTATPEPVDSGFDPSVDGFSFENYGDDVSTVDLTPAEMVSTFGDRVCASRAGGDCTLTPPGRQWMDQANEMMSSGHCEGMAVLSSLMYYGQIDPATFGGNTAHDLELDERLQREIARWFVTQGTDPGRSVVVNESPTAVLQTLTEHLGQGQAASEWWLLGIYKPDWSGGHALTPIGVEDRGNGLVHILVYDGNWPGQVRTVEVDTNANTWRYEGSTDPAALYEGDRNTGTLEVVALSPRLEAQECPFCAEEGTARGPGTAAYSIGQAFYQVWYDGRADLLIVDEAGYRIGYVDGQFVNQVAGSDVQWYRFGGPAVWNEDREPVYRVPVGAAFEITVDGSRLAAAECSEVSLIGPGHFLAVAGIGLEPGETDTVQVTVEEGRYRLATLAGGAEAPVVTIGVETSEADYAFAVQATEPVDAGETTFDVTVDLAEGNLVLNIPSDQETNLYDFHILRIDEEGEEQVFTGTALTVQPGNTAYLDYREWAGEGAVIVLTVDYETDGVIDASFELPDEGDAFPWDAGE